MKTFRPHTLSRRLAWPPFACAMASALVGCADARVRDGAPHIVRIDAAQMDAGADARQASLAQACQAWSLKPDQAARYFRHAQEYPDGTGDRFYWLPCSIKGRLLAAGREWEFEINAAATATWRSGDTLRRWGCSDRACRPLVLLMPDGNRP
ncbi:hypothetical protein [Lysobacter sp. CA199]|uniref:hypothetical protein n=1 Tax=Lysobacter sp. CA199 TaxID=3455608 RepID=UPI003F8D21CD